MKVVSPRTLDEALRALDGAGPDARVLAGGTDLVVEMETGRTRPDLVVDVWSVRELRGIRASDRGLEIGALTTCTDLLRNADAARCADVLVEAAREVGAVQIQNRATIGGNLGTASPAADMNPALFVLGASVRLVSRRGRREIPVERFVTGYRSTQRAHDELIEAVIVPPRPLGERRAFRKVGTRRAQSIAKLVVAVGVEHDEWHGPVCARIAFGSLSDRTVLLDERVGTELARALVGAPHRSRDARDLVGGEELAKLVQPRDDVRSTASYRRSTFLSVTRRLLLELAKST